MITVVYQKYSSVALLPRKLPWSSQYSNCNHKIFIWPFAAKGLKANASPLANRFRQVSAIIIGEVRILIFVYTLFIYFQIFGLFRFIFSTFLSPGSIFSWRPWTISGHFKLSALTVTPVLELPCKGNIILHTLKERINTGHINFVHLLNLFWRFKKAEVNSLFPNWTLRIIYFLVTRNFISFH